MDKSENYIKMCNNGFIQKLWRPKEGDCILVDNKVIILGTQMFGLPQKIESWLYPVMRIAIPEEKIFIDKLDNGYHDFKVRTFNFILKKFQGLWLPRQDQIQDMIGFYSKGYGMFRNFNDWLEDNRMYIAQTQLITPEQLWLAFYMHEINNLIWNGKKWEK